MKKLLFLFYFSLFNFVIYSQLPNINLKDVNGNNKNLSKLSNNGNPIIISFWATWCKPCKAELNTIAEEYDDWVDETGVKLIAISIDDARSSSRVEPYINVQGWDYMVLLDPNGDCKRAMNVNNVPHTFLINGSGKIVWDHNNYSIGDEDELYEELVKISK
ncbi:TlpA family protein disulfide reductase [Bacteroidota bacterium]|mgnify:FL=1|nr:TlpA family protein disulfide reductase [Bacteroidota bacterium]PDH49908.1 MAG: alkyl hydroperoxide reductase [Bacteroidetes bacterium MED-G20]RPG79450.1 MAG: TlpA family protein disulfide reductase [Crocinitomicaceae bacterium TMED135]CAI8173939.1 MAG: Thiol-disulfide oxidoreductase ResA [Crocinitomicaceae bacterium]|tara:strand:- start:2619 stop:3101 length:483 start_codon:yes stop_codon:yes gene_type:complete